MIVDEKKTDINYDYRGERYYFCSVACREAFSKDPDKLLEKSKGDLVEIGIRSYRPTGLRPYVIGVAAAMGVVGFYLGFLTLTSDWFNARSQFSEYAIWILSLAVGLGVQATLFSLYRAWHRGVSMKGAKYSLAASGGISTTAMAACCAHYLVVILPVLGLPFLSAAAAGLAGYQTYFFIAGVLSNLFGIGLMMRMMYRSGMIQLRGLKGYPCVKFQESE
jgi:YHS domain-containing protein